ncbi:MAG: Asp-tRNA(Asn)/Glu-tRNA(Gln) amidotransferase subunit GatB [Bacteroidetes bacterium]|nr:Asp-tRNA(Asn)/Glu-tRNA(Gln) amidotransferase subunit GatB [Bacteroidota bacterium]
MNNTEFEAVIGLEIHVQLLTASKAFSSDSAEYGGLPNTQISAISLGHPGTLPRHNKSAVEMAVKMGLALHCDIRKYNSYSRKNYFYADLPKGYQITQFDTPLCNNGYVPIRLKDGTRKQIGLIRIHMEEDTGKSMHDQDLTDTLVDYNRAGTPLIEIVSEPEIRTGDEAYAFVTEIRRLVRYLGICDGNMEEGSLRCDANISVRPRGTTTFGTKVEVKNMNSISNVKRAIDFEIARQTELILSGGTVVGETRGFNALAGTTFSMRRKELVNDYRYFPEPDLPPLILTDQQIEAVKHLMPELPDALYARFTEQYGLSEYDAGVLVDDKHTALYYENLVRHTSNYKAAANWVSVAIRGYLNEQAMGMEDFSLQPEKIADIIHLIDKGVLSHSAAVQKLFPAMVQDPAVSAEEWVQKLNLVQNTDNDFIEKLADEVLASMPEKVAEYRNGKTGLLGLFVGEVMKLSKGKAEPRKTNEVIRRKLDA